MSALQSTVRRRNLTLVRPVLPAWIDIDNPPQVQYLLPFARALEARGARVLVTARDYGIALDLLDQAGADYVAVGSSFGAGRVRKVTGLVRRAAALRRVVKEHGQPAFLLSASRPSAVAARSLGIPSFIVGDYEFANVSVYRYTRSHILHPDVVDPEVFAERGFPAKRLISFRGLKEDISFAGVELDDVRAHEFPQATEGKTRILFRPPAEESHYFRPESRDLALSLLEHLAGRDDLVVVFSPRYDRQIDDLAGFAWKNEPIVLREGVPFVPLLKAVDAVISSGGTMLREAAYLGTPAYSIFQSEIGGVDRHLAAIGRLTIIESPEDFERIEPAHRERLATLESNPALLDELLDLITSRVAA
jgi:hypothetical protein